MGQSPVRRSSRTLPTFPRPTTLKAARSWFSLIKQVALSYSIGDTTVNFRDLVKPTAKTCECTPSLKELQKARIKIINMVKDRVKTFDIHEMTCVSTDWSKLEIGFLVTQKHYECSIEKAPRCCKERFKIVFGGSKKFFDAESRYAPIEGEVLGVVWSLEKARMFTLGCSDL